MTDETKDYSGAVVTWAIPTGVTTLALAVWDSGGNTTAGTSLGATGGSCGVRSGISVTPGNNHLYYVADYASVTSAFSDVVVSISTLIRASTTVTCTTATNHGLTTGNYALIDVAETNLKGFHQVTRVSDTVFTYTVPNSGSTTGTGNKTCGKVLCSTPFGATTVYTGGAGEYGGGGGGSGANSTSNGVAASGTVGGASGGDGGAGGTGDGDNGDYSGTDGYTPGGGAGADYNEPQYGGNGRIKITYTAGGGGGSSIAAISNYYHMVGGMR